MKKIFAIIASLCFAISISAETVFTFTSAADLNQTKDGISVVIAANGGTTPLITNDYESGKPEVRLYLNNTITISSATALTNIQLVFARSSASKGVYSNLSANSGELVTGGESTAKDDWKVDTWTGSATNVVFTLTEPGKQRQIRQIVIDGEPVVIDPDADKLPTEDDLDPSYTYQDPQIVQVPDTQIFGKEYAFINGNILVHCTKGSIVLENTTEGKEEAAYFGCQENQQLTFTATQNILGIAINGNVRKAFTASASIGDIYYCADDEQETAADPVLVVQNINAKSVTINCDKNLSCYQVRVYFAENPTTVCEEVAADTTDLYPVSAVAVDYSDSTDYSSEGSYSYWVKLSCANEYPQIWLDIYSAVKGDLSGWYSPYAYNVGEQTYVWFSDGETDAVTAYDTDVTIEKIANGYKMEGVLTCWEQGKEYEEDSEDVIYRFSYEGPVTFAAPGTEGIEAIESQAQTIKALREGQVIIIKNGRTYNTLGAEIK